MANGSLNIILHGLLFLELNKNSKLTWLEITAPKLPKHNLLMGTPGNLQNINNQRIHWETGMGLTPGTPRQPFDEGIPEDVPDTLFRFNRNTTDVGDIDLTGDQGKIFLPWPGQWDTIRRGNRPNLASRLPGKALPKRVNIHIERLCSTQIGVATVLTYDYTTNLPPLPNWSPNVNIEVYFQPDNPETVAEVNADLRTASQVLFSSDNFDLKFKEDDNSIRTSTPIGKTKYPAHSGLTVTDELSLSEKVTLLDPLKIPDGLRDCLSSLESYLLLQSSNPGLSGTDASKTITDERAERYMSYMMANPANCPMFFLGG
ncbi:MAG TPA: hypothetical protein VFQ41_03725 [Candidatus Angelobacter sp.]|nr:hypothetical protein [Candidatus Angelobacter sp.]